MIKLKQNEESKEFLYKLFEQLVVYIHEIAENERNENTDFLLDDMYDILNKVDIKDIIISKNNFFMGIYKNNQTTMFSIKNKTNEELYLDRFLYLIGINIQSYNNKVLCNEFWRADFPYLELISEDTTISFWDENRNFDINKIATITKQESIYDIKIENSPSFQEKENI